LVSPPEDRAREKRCLSRPAQAHANEFKKKDPKTLVELMVARYFDAHAVDDLLQ